MQWQCQRIPAHMASPFFCLVLTTVKYLFLSTLPNILPFISCMCIILKEQGTQPRYDQLTTCKKRSWYLLNCTSQHDLVLQLFPCHCFPCIVSSNHRAGKRKYQKGFSVSTNQSDSNKDQGEDAPQCWSSRFKPLQGPVSCDTSMSGLGGRG